MSEKVMRLGINRQVGFLYFLRDDGIYKTRSNGRGRGPITKVQDLYLPRRAGYLYFIDADGDVSRTVSGRNGRPAPASY